MGKSLLSKLIIFVIVQIAIINIFWVKSQASVTCTIWGYERTCEEACIKTNNGYRCGTLEEYQSYCNWTNEYINPYNFYCSSTCSSECGSCGDNPCWRNCGDFPTPTPAPQEIACGITGCNSPNYCVTGTTCQGNRCVKTCPQGQHLEVDSYCQCVPDFNNPQGGFIQPNCTDNYRIAGWAGDRDNINAPVQVEIWTSFPGGPGSILATVPADQQAWPAVCEALGGSAASCAVCATTGGPQCNHVFTYTLPESFRDNQTRNFRLVVRNIYGGGAFIKIPAEGLPALQLTCAPPNSAPSCSNISFSTPTTITKGDTTIITANVSDANSNLNEVRFYWTPEVAGSNYCIAPWTLLGIGTPNNAKTQYTLSLNTTDLNAYGPIKIVANVDDSGSPRLTCTGNPSCTGTTPGTCCGSNYVTCGGAGTSCNATLTINPACNNSFTMTSSNSCNTVSLNVSGQPTSHTAFANTIDSGIDEISLTGCVWDPTKTSTTPPCNAVNANNFNWKHDWQDCVTFNGKSYCSAYCTKLLPDQPSGFIEETCKMPDINYSPNTFQWGSTNIITLSGFDTNSTITNQNSYFDDMSCIPKPAIEPNAKFECTMEPEYKDSYSWNYSWTETSKTCGNLTKQCSFTDSITAEAPESFFMTEKGSFYAGNTEGQDSINLKSFPSSQSISTYVFSTKVINKVKLGSDTGCTTAGICSSKNDLIKTDYTDSNSAPEVGWFAYFKGLLSQDTNNYIAKNSGDTLSNVAGYDKKIVYFPNNQTLSSNQACSKQVIFLIDGSLTINTNITTSGNGACVFIVRDTTTVGGGFATILASGANEIHAYIITKNFETIIDNQRFELTGGLVTTGTTTLKRNLNSAIAVIGDKPSEKFIYEGARYIDIFKDVMSGSTDLKIRELGINN